jgi:FixJ family two-component response regulator
MKDINQPILHTPRVYLVDDDEAVLDSLATLFDSVGVEHSCYASALAFLSAYPGDTICKLTGCVVLDIRMPGMSGMECQQKLIERQCSLPIIFITGHGDVPMAVEAMKLGAVEFIQKPFREQALLDCIHKAMELNKQTQTESLETQLIKNRLQTLSQREQQVLHMVTCGQANKVIASELNLSQRTIEIHRANVMEKMQAKSLAELVTMVLTQE